MSSPGRPAVTYSRESRLALLPGILRERILVLDGAMGTMLQRHRFTEEDFRGERFADHPRDLRGDNDLLCLTRPDAVREVHAAYLRAGADVVTTNSFTATRIAQADYGLEGHAREINEAAARLAREAPTRPSDETAAPATSRARSAPPTARPPSPRTSTTRRPATPASRTCPPRTRSPPRA
jgi:5-methyltetrahydrofolate--homocysteine methyltransferase